MVTPDRRSRHPLHTGGMQNRRTDLVRPDPMWASASSSGSRSAGADGRSGQRLG